MAVVTYPVGRNGTYPGFILYVSLGGISHVGDTEDSIMTL